MTNRTLQVSAIIDAFLNDASNLIKFAEDAFTPEYPKTNIYYIEKDSSFVIESAVPGFSKEDINVHITGDILTIRGTKAHGNKDDTKKDAQPPLEGIDDVPEFCRHYFSRQLAQRAFENQFKLTPRLDYMKTKVRIKDGLLTVTIPLKEEEKPKKFEVPVE